MEGSAWQDPAFLDNVKQVSMDICFGGKGHDGFVLGLLKRRQLQREGTECIKAQRRCGYMVGCAWTHSVL